MAGAGRATAGGWQSLLWRDTGLAIPADAGRDWGACWAGEGDETDGVRFSDLLNRSRSWPKLKVLSYLCRNGIEDTKIFESGSSIPQSAKIVLKACSIGN